MRLSTRILELLAKGGSLKAAEIAARLGVTRAEVNAVAAFKARVRARDVAEVWTETEEAT